MPRLMALDLRPVHSLDEYQVSLNFSYSGLTTDH
jgi:hypothetical protein